MEKHGVKGVFNKFKLTSDLDIAIKKIAEDIDLNVYQTFRLLEDFIFENIQILPKINKGASPSLINSLTTQLYLKYNKERGSVFKTLNVIMRFAIKQDNMTPSQEFAREFITDLVQNKNLHKNLWDCYKKLGSVKLSNAAKSKKGIHIDQILSEQLWIQRNLYFGFANNLFNCDGNMYLDMLNTFINEDFIGYLKGCEETNFNDYEDIRSKSTQLFNVSGLVLVAALNVQVILENNPHQLLKINQAPISIFSGENLGKIIDLIAKVLDNPTSAVLENSHIFKVIVQVLDYLKEQLHSLKSNSDFEK